MKSLNDILLYSIIALAATTYHSVIAYSQSVSDQIEIKRDETYYKYLWRQETELFFVEKDQVSKVRNITSNKDNVLIEYSSGERRIVELKSLDSNEGFIQVIKDKALLVDDASDPHAPKTLIVHSFNEQPGERFNLIGAVVEKSNSKYMEFMSIDEVKSRIFTWLRFSNQYIISTFHNDLLQAKIAAKILCEESNGKINLHLGELVTSDIYSVVCVRQNEVQINPTGEVLNDAFIDIFTIPDHTKNITVSRDKNQFCAKSTNDKYFQEMLYDSNNRMSFLNSGGHLNIGVCWWMSMFQRNATYLTIFKPNLPGPSEEEVEKIIQDIIEITGIVIIPGSSNLFEFTRKYQKIIKAKIYKWQLSEGSLGGGLFRGLYAQLSKFSTNTQKDLDEIYKEVKIKNKITFVTLAFTSSRTAHSWLIFNMEKTNYGYVLDILDSNTGNILRKHFHKDRKLFIYNHKSYGNLEMTKVILSRNWMDFDKFSQARQSFCEKNMSASDIREERERFKY